MKNYILFSAISYWLLAIGCPLKAQDWRQMMRDPNANFYDVQKAFYAVHPKEDGKKEINKSEPENGEDIFKRWENMMEPRTYPSGNRPDITLVSAEYNKIFAERNN